jgi:hypothetical protein
VLDIHVTKVVAVRRGDGGSVGLDKSGHASPFRQYSQTCGADHLPARVTTATRAEEILVTLLD